MTKRRGSAFASTYPSRQQKLTMNSPQKQEEPQPSLDQFQTSNFGLRKPDELDIKSMMPPNLKHYKSCTNRFKRLVSNNKLLRPQTQGALNEALLTKDEQLKTIVRHLMSRPQTQQSKFRFQQNKSVLSDKITAVSPNEDKREISPVKNQQSNDILSLNLIPKALNISQGLTTNVQLKKNVRSSLEKFQVKPRSPNLQSAKNIGSVLTHVAASRTPSPNGLLDVNTKHMHIGLRQDLSTIQTELNTVNQYMMHRNHNLEESEDCSDQPSLLHLQINKETLSPHTPQITLKIHKSAVPELPAQAVPRPKRVVLKQVEPLRPINFQAFQNSDECHINDFYSQLIGPLRDARRVINSRQLTGLGINSNRRENSCDSNQSGSKEVPLDVTEKSSKQKTPKMAVRNKVFSIDHRVQAEMQKNRMGSRAQMNRRFKSQRPFLYPTLSN